MKTIGVALLLLSIAAGAATAQLAVIAHSSAQAPSLTRAQVTDIYTLSQTAWPDGTPVVVVDLRKPSPAKERFYAAIDKDPSDLRKEWMRAILTGKAKAPEGVDTESEMLKMVATTPGAIGYLRATAVTSEVKVLLRLE
jgi:ABC-type phosphate transport system substrate-binding protein